MKKVSIVLFFASALLWACSPQERYLNLNTGEKVELEKDPETGLMVDAKTKQPVYLYVDTKTNDTIYGKTGKVVNGEIVRIDNEYKFKGDYEYKSADGDLKVEVEKDGDIKIKDGDSKLKVDGETGEKKVKKDD
jgi:hypothetical protein